MRPKTSLVHLTQSKGRVCQGCDVYMGPKVNNSEWILSQSLWSNPFDSHDLTPMQFNEMYSRHIDHTPYLRNSLCKLVRKCLGVYVLIMKIAMATLWLKKSKRNFHQNVLKIFFVVRGFFSKESVLCFLIVTNVR